MSTPNIEFAQPDGTMPFGRRLKKIAKYLRIALPSFTRTFTATLPEETRWKIEIYIPGRTFGNSPDSMEFFIEAPTWTLGKDIAAQITLG